MLGTLFCDDNVVHGHGGEGGGLLCGGETVGGGGGTVQQGIGGGVVLKDERMKPQRWGGHGGRWQQCRCF
jgi:hypothetical protein